MERTVQACIRNAIADSCHADEQRRADALVQACVSLERELRTRGFYLSWERDDDDGDDDDSGYEHDERGTMDALQFADRKGCLTRTPELVAAVRTRNEYVHHGRYPELAIARVSVLAFNMAIADLSLVCAARKCGLKATSDVCPSCGRAYCKDHAKHIRCRACKQWLCNSCSQSSQLPGRWSDRWWCAKCGKSWCGECRRGGFEPVEIVEDVPPRRPWPKRAASTRSIRLCARCAVLRAADPPKGKEGP